MNDRFKFRAWDKEREIMVDAMHFPWKYITEEEDFIVMQCTGLKDKNGNLIYEGDICFQNRKNFRNNKAIGIIYRTEFGEYVLRVDMSSQWTDEYKDFSLKKYPVTIIGNIHENPELLEEGE